MIYGLDDPDEPEQSLEAEVQKVLSEIDEKPVIRECCRLSCGVEETRQ